MKRGPKFKQVNCDEILPGYAYAAFDAKRNLIEYGTKGKGLPYIIYHEVGHAMIDYDNCGTSLDDRRISFMTFYYTGHVSEAVEHEEIEAWRIGARLCPGELLVKYYDYIRIGLKSYRIKPPSFQTVIDWYMERFK